MAQIQCKQGHFYDYPRYSTCPWCPVPGLNLGPDPPQPGGAAGPAQRGGSPAESTPAAAGAARSPSQSDANPRVASIAHPKTVIKWKRAPQAEGADKAAEVERNPVVGWLVAIGGPALGRDFRIHAYNNTIGRGAANHIRIPDDPEIHTDAHAVIAYDPLGNTYYIKPGEQVQFAYVSDPVETPNWQPVMGPMVLDPHKLILIGATQLMFVPLCGEEFKWNL